MSGTLQTGADYLRQILKAPVYEVAAVTPLQAMPRLTQRIGNHVQIKREDRQPVHSLLAVPTIWWPVYRSHKWLE